LFLALIAQRKLHAYFCQTIGTGAQKRDVREK
jgi:hypothetical protein